MGSGLRVVAPRCLSTENAGRTMSVLRHALCGDDFHQAPVSIILAKNVPSFFFSGFVGDATQVIFCAGTSLASQSSHLNNAVFYYLPASLLPFSFLVEEPSFSLFCFVFVDLFCMYEHVVKHLQQ